jgi:S1-C subfamily serine protease
MEKENKEYIQEQTDEEMDWDVFFAGEEPQEWEKEKAQRKKRKIIIGKIVSSLLVFALLISGLGMWFDVFNLPAFRFIEVSNRLSKKPEVNEYKKSVVTIEWNGVKGTGFNVASEGLIVTNAHVVENTNRVNVHLNTGESFVGKVITKHPELDLAIVDIEAKNLPILPLAVEKEWEQQVGEKITFIGNPLAFTQIANEGTIVGKVMLKDIDAPVMMINAPIYKGNSGSPVINQHGEVIGVIFATIQDPAVETKEIIGVAIPSFYIQTILKE